MRNGGARPRLPAIRAQSQSGNECIMSSTAPQVCHERSVELEAQLEELEAQSSSSKRNQVPSDAQRREEGRAAEAHHAAAAGVAEAAFGRWPIRRDPGSRLGRGWTGWTGVVWVVWVGNHGQLRGGTQVQTERRQRARGLLGCSGPASWRLLMISE